MRHCVFQILVDAVLSSDVMFPTPELAGKIHGDEKLIHYRVHGQERNATTGFEQSQIINISYIRRKTLSVKSCIKSNPALYSWNALNSSESKFYIISINGAVDECFADQPPLLVNQGKQGLVHATP